MIYREGSRRRSLIYKLMLGIGRTLRDGDALPMLNELERCVFCVCMPSEARLAVNPGGGNGEEAGAKGLG